MRDQGKTKEQLIEELCDLRKKIGLLKFTGPKNEGQKHGIPDAEGDMHGVNEDTIENLRMHKLVKVEIRQERDLFLYGPTVVLRWLASEGWPVDYVSSNMGISAHPHHMFGLWLIF